MSGRWTELVCGIARMDGAWLPVSLFVFTWLSSSSGSLVIMFALGVASIYWNAHIGCITADTDRSVPGVVGKGGCVGLLLR